MFERRAERVEQKELWIEVRELPAATPDRFLSEGGANLGGDGLCQRGVEDLPAGLCRCLQGGTARDRSGGLFEDADGGFL